MLNEAHRRKTGAMVGYYVWLTLHRTLCKCTTSNRWCGQCYSVYLF